MRKTLVSAFGFIILMLTAIAWAAPVPDTGQTKCFNATVEIPCPSPGQPFYGQDAQYTINPMSYTKLDVNGAALSDSATSWVMVKDNVTGLVWETKNNKDYKADYSNPHDADNTYTWYDSNPATNGGNAGTLGSGTDTEDFIKALNDAHYGGYSDWRLPTINELVYIVNYSLGYSSSYTGPTIDTKYFLNTQRSSYWSSTTFAPYTYFAWFVKFNSGEAGGYYVNSGNEKGNWKGNSHYARAVRGGQSGSFGDLSIKSFDTIDSGSMDDASTATSAYTDNGDGTVTDASTGLMWQQASSSNKTWEQALAYCEGLNLGGYTNWRLPTIRELRSLVDYNRYEPSINTVYFPDTAAAASCYCSSTTHVNLTDYAWGVCFSSGNGEAFKSSYGYARAVRMVTQAPAESCTATLDGNLLIHIPVLASLMDWWWAPAYLADFVYEYNPTYPTLIIFKMTNLTMLPVARPECVKEKSTYSDDLKIHIPGLLLADGITRLSVDMEYSPALSTDVNAYFIVTKIE